MHKFVLGLLGAASLTMGSTAANAVVVFNNIDNALLALSGSEFFGANIVGEPGAFAYTFSFFLASDSSANSSVTTTQLGGNDIDFSSILLDGFAFTQTGFDPAAENWELSAVNISSGLRTIFVNGTVGSSGNGSFSGVLNVAANTAGPEPGTWAMMLLGFGAAGYSIRRRRTPALFQAA